MTTGFLFQIRIVYMYITKKDGCTQPSFFREGILLLLGVAKLYNVLGGLRYYTNTIIPLSVHKYAQIS